VSHSGPSVALAAILWCLGAYSFPAHAACDLSEPETGTVSSVLDGETLKLADGRIVRLIGAKAPSAPLGWRGDDPWPLVEEAKQALDKLASGKEVELKYGGRHADRYDHLLAQVFVMGEGKPLWLQQELVAEGLARVYSFPDNRACVAELLARESEARGKHLGVWGSSAYRIESADDVTRLGRLTRSYQLVEGIVAKVGEGAGRLYLNFAEDWRSDFTISIDRKDMVAFTSTGIDPKALAGKRLRVRGWIEWRNGPMIAATHPEQIEILPEAPASVDAKPNSPAPGAPGL
jgi:endonuclease YncB( thermonuclease family)